ncbi:MAG: tRNA-dependent cyclodipeptide synthase [Patescibacteria group bacterium]
MDLREHSNGEKVEIGILGISMGNSRFSEDYIRTLFEEMRSEFPGLAVMLPDVPAQSTLQALGYSHEKIGREVRLSFNGIINKCRRAIDLLEIPNVTMISWSDRAHFGDGKQSVNAVPIGENLNYLKTYQEIQGLYRNNKTFNSDINYATRGVLQGKKRKDGRKMNEDDVQIGTKFLLQELAFIINAADILEAKSTSYVYHELMPVLENLYKGKYGYSPAPNTGFAVYN